MKEEVFGDMEDIIIFAYIYNLTILQDEMV